MAGYTRQSTFADGDTITAALFNNEYNQLLNAFGNTSGHKHDGTANEGPVIGLIGDAGVVTPLNKVLIDSTNDHIEFWIEVSSSAVQQLYIADGAIVPVTDNDIDLGTSSLQFKDLYINGTANIDSLVLATGSTVTAILDEDDLSSDSATSLVTQQSVKAYIDAQVTAQDLDFLGDSGGALSIDLDSESLTIAGGTGLDTVGSSNTITINIDATVATLTGTQTLTNKTIDVDNNTVSNIEVDNFKASAIVLESEGIGSNDNDTSLPTSAAVKDYVDTQITAEDLDITTDSGTIAIDLDSETLTVSGGTGLDSSATGNAVTLAIDSTVTTLTGTQTLTNKTLTSPVINTGVSGTAFLDDDTFGTATASTLASSESIKAYVDTTVAATNEVVEDTTPQLGGDLDLNSNDITGTGNINITGTIQSSGNITGTLATAAQTNITSVGTLSSLNVGSSIIINNTNASSFGVMEVSGTSGAFIDLKSPSSDDFDLRMITSGTGGQINAAAGTLDLQIAGSSILSVSSTGIDVTGTIVGDGLTISSATANVADLRRANNAGAGQVLLGNSDGHVRLSGTNGSFDVFNSGNTAQRFGIANNGDISFYEDTGSTQALFWDASAESLGIGVTNPSRKLTVSESSQYAMNTLNPTSTAGNKSGIAFHGLNSASLTQFYAGISANFDNTAGGAQSGSLIFETINSNSISEKMRIDSSGNVGIGTNSPATTLTVEGSGANGIELNQNGADASQSARLFFDSSTSGYALMNVSGSLTFNSGSTAGASSGTERMRIDSSGSVGIGTTSPSEKLQINDGRLRFLESGQRQYNIGISSGTSNFQIYDATYSYAPFTIDGTGNVGIRTDSPDGNLHVSSGSAGTVTASTDANELVLEATANVGMTLLTGNSSIARIRFGDADSNARGNIFYNHANDSLGVQTAASTAMTINSSGNVGIGTTSPDTSLQIGNISATNATGQGRIKLEDTSTALSSVGGLEFTTSAFGSGYGWKVNSIDAGGGVHLAFGTRQNSTTWDEKVRIDSSGNVGINTTSPSAKLEVTGATLVSDDGANDFVKQSVSGTTSTLSFGSTEETGGLAKWQYSRSTGKFSGFVGTDAATEFMTINSSGRVGIGTNNPGVNLEVSENGTCNFRMTDASSPTTYSQFASANGVLQIRADAGNAQSASSMQFFVDADEAMRIDSSGNVGIGTTSPSQSLHVDASGGGVVRVTRLDNSASAYGQLEHDGTNTTLKSSAQLIFNSSGSETARIDSSGNLRVGVGNTFEPTIQFTNSGRVEGNPGYSFNGDLDTGMFNPSSQGTIAFSNNGTESVRIDSSGNLLVGKTSANDFASAGVQIEPAGQITTSIGGDAALKLNRGTNDGNIIEFNKSGTTVGSVSVTASATAYNTSSDARLKDVTGEARGLEVITKLNPVAYNWKADGKADEGLIAQEVKELVPNAVTGSEDEMYQMDYSKLVVHLVKAVKEQQTQIEALQSEINNLKGE